MRRIAIMLLCLQGLFSSYAQQNKEEFGKNRIQYKQFKWEYISSENFHIYYYDNRSKLTRQVITYLEEEFERITDLIGYTPYFKSKLFIYNSITDLQQSNIGLYQTEFGISGKAKFVKPYAEIAHTGSIAEFKKELIHGVSKMIINQMMFGGSLKNMVKNAILLSLPDWFIAGVTRYIAYGWDAELDDYARQLTYTKNEKKALQFTGDEAALVGQSIWNYIAEKYGQRAISNILNYTRVIRNERRGMLITLGTSYRKIIRDWRAFYAEDEEAISAHYIYPKDSMRIRASNRKRKTIYTTAKISPDGNKVAYAENDRGRFIVKIKSLKDNKETVVLRGGYRLVGQEVNRHIPLLDWVDQNILGVIGIKREVYTFWLYDLSSKTKSTRTLNRFNNVQSLDFSNNGRLAVLSADSHGQNDLFLLSTRRDRIRRLTHDLYDDIDPSFFPHSNKILFSSNRVTDTVTTSVKKIDALSTEYNLYVFDLDTSKNVVKKITNTASKKYHPHTDGEGLIYYVSDQQGIPNIFRYSQADSSYRQITNFKSGIKTYDLNLSTQSLAFILKKDLRENIFIASQLNPIQPIVTPIFRRKKSLEKKNREAIQRQKKILPKLSLKELINAQMKALGEDTSSFSNSISEIKQDNLPSNSTHLPVQNKQTVSTNPTIKTNHYTFEDDANTTPVDGDTFLTKYMKKKEGLHTIKGPFPYQPRFTYKNIIASLTILPLKGFGINLEIQMNDILENYRFFGGLKTAFNLESGVVYAEAQYLPHKIDYSLRIERKSILWNEAINTNMYTWQKIELGASLPISTRWRLTFKPFIGFTRYVDRGILASTTIIPSPPVFLPEATQSYVGYKAALIYDNSISTGINVSEGTKGKIGFTHYEGIGNKKAGFMHAHIDIRHYQKIHKNIIIAVRGHIGQFFGSSPKKYALGGVDNWMRFAGLKLNRQGVNNPLHSTEGFNNHLLFINYGTLRGFDYATLYGNGMILLNVELRIPIFHTLTSGPLFSTFFKNFQLVAFYDIGTSWIDSLSFSANNSPSRIVPERDTSNPFRAEIKDFINPWLYSFGTGFRAKILGLYMKFDVAWSVKNYQIRSPQLIGSLGFDF